MTTERRKACGVKGTKAAETACPMIDKKGPSAALRTVVPAQHGSKQIVLEIRFWTDGIDGEHVDKRVVKRAWGAGVVTIRRNKVHRIEPITSKHFHTMLELPMVIEEMLIEHGITLHDSRKEQKYREEDWG